MTDHKYAPTSLGNSLHALSLDRGKGHGFFDEDILSRQQAALGNLTMRLCGSGNGNGDNPFVT